MAFGGCGEAKVVPSRNINPSLGKTLSVRVTILTDVRVHLFNSRQHVYGVDARQMSPLP